ncbi:MAG: hypothetical protein ABR936_15425 [Bacteroidota bacterium]|jgi:hypothetical protein
MTHTLFQAAGVAIVVFIFWQIKLRLSRGRKFSDFIIGDDGRYSLSRLQAVVWATIIMSHQFTVFLIVAIHNQVSSFQLVFAENALWLLGISLGSYVSVKGITINQAQKSGVPLRRYNPDLSNLVTGENGLDFSRFQMLAWTILGVSVYLVQCNSYDYCLNDLVVAGKDLKDIFTDKFLPDISGTFTILMGLSQGAYIGKKLVPSYQVKTVRTASLRALQAQADTLEIEIKYAQEGLAAQKPSTLSDREKIEKDELDLRLKQSTLADLRTQINEISRALSETE